MKLLYFTIQINMLGGLAKIVIEKINWLVAHGYDVTLCNIERLDVVPAYPIDPKVKLLRGDISTVPGGALTRLKGVLGAVKRTREIIVQEKPDVIVNAHCPLVTWILPFIKLKVKSEKLKINRYRPLIITEMHQSRQGLEVFNLQFMGTFSRWLHRWSIRWIYGRYDKFVVLTNGDREQWNTKNCVVIPNFSSISAHTEKTAHTELTDSTEFMPERKLGKNEEKISVSSVRDKHQIIMLARLMPQKRIDLMIEVWAKLAKDFPNWQVKVLGDGMLKEELESMVERLGIKDSFLLLGGVKDVSSELENSDILCLTSEYEGFGIVLIEAMLKSIPVMAFEYVGVHDIIENGVDGYVVTFGDVDAYADRLRELMTSEEQRRKFAKSALESVKKFDKERVMNMWVELFQSLRRQSP
ncbi:MAG: glycosyltransferase family 4 protein [Prevotellaceae bacterium]|nr:glycosyltransferase family 4 protein [Candidatus Colivivens equi]